MMIEMLIVRRERKKLIDLAQYDDNVDISSLQPSIAVAT